MSRAHEKMADNYRGRPAARAVLWRLARHAKSDGSWSISIGELAVETGFSAKTVRAALRQLVVEGLVERRERMRKNRSRAEDLFIVKLEALVGAASATHPLNFCKGPLEEVPGLASLVTDPDRSDLPNGRSDPTTEAREADVANLHRPTRSQRARLAALLSSASVAVFRDGSTPGSGEAAASAGSASAPRRSGADPPKSKLTPTTGWRPGAAEIKSFQDLGLQDEEIESATREFVDYWSRQFGQRAYKADWPAAWRVQIYNRLGHAMDRRRRAAMAGGAALGDGDRPTYKSAAGYVAWKRRRAANRA